MSKPTTTPGSSQPEPWGLQWRSSTKFIVATMSIALLTDVYMYGFLVPLLPYVIEHRLGLDESITQRISTAFLALSAAIQILVSPIIGLHADRAGAKREWLLAGLAGASVGSLVIALATSVWTLFAGRLIQAVASTALWVVGFATLANNTPPGDTGKVYGLVTVAIAVGTSGGPLVGGVLLDLGGYWVAWSSVLVVIIVDVILRCLMIENNIKNSTPVRTKLDEEETEAETEPLLPSLTESNGEVSILEPEKTGIHFYYCLFTNSRFCGGIVSYLCFAILLTSFDATLPLHVRATFQWGALPSGLLFAVFQGPGVLLSVPIGWLKDRVGTRYPISIGFALLVPLLWVIGIPGDERFPWASQGQVGPIIYSAAVCCAGVVITLLNGVGMMEATQAVDEIQGQHPGIFGPNGGYSRAMSITSMSWTLGMFIGPILAGYGTEQIGYYGMNCVLAGMCAICAFIALGCLKSSVPQTSSHPCGEEPE